MKKSLFYALAIIVIVFVSCDQEPSPVQTNPVYFESFGLYAEDNVDIIVSDYIVNNISTTNVINIELPSTTYSENLKRLCPRFVVSSEDVTVSVDPTLIVVDETGDSSGTETLEEQVDNTEDNIVTSGKTKIDFSSPVEFLLSNGTDNFIYTVNVTIAPENFKLIASATDNLLTGPQVAIDNSNNIYIAEVMNSDNDDYDFPVMYEFKDGMLSDAIKLTESRANSHGIAIDCDPQGVPYMSFQDYTDDLNKTTVMKVESGKPTVVGSYGAIYRLTNPGAIFPVSADNIFVAGNNAVKQDNLAKRALNIAQYSGGNWTNALSIPGRTLSSGYNVMGHIINGVPYLMVLNYPDESSYSMYKYIDTGWTTVFEQLQLKKQDGTLITEGYALWFDFDVASDGSIYIAVAGQFLTEDYVLTVLKYNSSTNDFDFIPGPSPVIYTSNQQRVEFTLDNNDVPYLAYNNRTDGSYRPFITYIDPNTTTWTTPEPVCAEHCEDPQLIFDSNNKLYVVTTANDMLAIYARK